MWLGATEELGRGSAEPPFRAVGASGRSLLGEQEVSVTPKNTPREGPCHSGFSQISLLTGVGFQVPSRAEHGDVLAIRLRDDGPSRPEGPGSTSDLLLRAPSIRDFMDLKSVLRLFLPPIVVDLLRAVRHGGAKFEGVFQAFSDIPNEDVWNSKQWIDLSRSKLERNWAAAPLSPYMASLSLLLDLKSLQEDCRVLDFGGGTGFVYPASDQTDSTWTIYAMPVYIYRRVDPSLGRT